MLTEGWLVGLNIYGFIYQLISESYLSELKVFFSELLQSFRLIFFIPTICNINDLQLVHTNVRIHRKYLHNIKKKKLHEVLYIVFLQIHFCFTPDYNLFCIDRIYFLNDDLFPINLYYSKMI